MECEVIPSAGYNTNKRSLQNRKNIVGNRAIYLFASNRGGGGSGTAVDAVGVSGKDIRRYPVLMSDGSLIRKGPAVAGAVFGGHPAFALVLFGGAPGPSAIVGLLQQNVAGAQF